MNKLNKERNEIVSYYDNLLKKSQKDEETSFDDGKGIPSELIVDTSSIPTGTTEPVSPVEVKVTEEVKSDIEKPSVEQQAKDSKEGNLVTFTYKSEAEVPEAFKDRISSSGENKVGLFGKKEKVVRVTVPKSLAEYELNKSKVTPTEVKVTEEVKDLSKSSEAELEKRLLEIEDSASDTPERAEANKIDKELEKREWRKVFDSPLDKVTEVADELIKKNEEQPSGFGSYIESWDARSLKLIANKYSKENVKKLTDSEIIKDYKDAMFGNQTSWYSD
ncbi:MAG: hypothetical protein NTZ48_06220 [Candidatus Omnitrophica bacterium]|nr:hypothetical protein [Candidatus Omnitrophota bacterium]